LFALDVLERSVDSEYGALAAPVPPQYVAAGYNSIFLANFRILVKFAQLAERQARAIASGRPSPLTPAVSRRLLHQFRRALPALETYRSQHSLTHCVTGLISAATIST
jgi:hypothetical protein